ncbi:MAG: helix-hairpin-helix domain-containing protein, partial [Gammaproteobacteria bacterium]
ADAAMLAAAIDGVGEQKAAIIIQHRERHGPFASVDELANVKGIGSGTVQRNRQKLTVVPVTGRVQANKK